MDIENEKLSVFLDLINQRTAKLETRRGVSVDEYLRNYDLHPQAAPGIFRRFARSLIEFCCRE